MALAALCYLLITALLFRNLLPHIATHLFGDLGDPLLNTAILAWNATHVPLTRDWWNFPAFAPLSGITAFTEHFLGAYPLTSPVIWMTGNAVLAYNLLELTCFTLNGVAAYALVRELTASRAGAFVGGLAFAFAPFVGEHVTHVQMLMAYGMPFALLGLHRYLKEQRPRYLLWFGIGWLDVLLSNAYLLVFFPILVALWALWFFRRPDVRAWINIALTTVIATAPVVPLLLGYRLRQTAYGLSRGLDEIRQWSAAFGSIAGITHRSLLWRGWLPDTFYEASLFPGFAIAALVLLGLLNRRRRTMLFYLVGAWAMWWLALGPERGPYWLLLKVPGAQSIRVPARAWLPATVCLAVCAGFGGAWLAHHRRARWLIAPLAALIVAEAWFAAPSLPAPARQRLAIPVDALVLDLPLEAGYLNADPQYLAVLGKYRVLNGYSGYEPPHFEPLRAALAAHRPDALAPFRALTDIYVIARPQVDRATRAWLEAQPGLELLSPAGDWTLYRLPRTGSEAPLRLPLPLPKAGEAALAVP
jgi:hypothetical protein